MWHWQGALNRPRPILVQSQKFAQDKADSALNDGVDPMSPSSQKILMRLEYVNKTMTADISFLAT